MWVKKAQNGWNFLSRSFQPFPFVSACGSRCGSSTILEDFLDEAKPRRPQSYGGFVELLSRFELETSSLPRMRSTD